MTTAVTLTDAQAAIVAMMEVCGLRQVQINVNPEYNRYSKQGTNAAYMFTDLEDLAEQMKPAPEMVQTSIFKGEI